MVKNNLSTKKYSAITVLSGFTFTLLLIFVSFKFQFITDINQFVYINTISSEVGSQSIFWRIVTAFGGASVISFFTAIATLYLLRKKDVEDSLRYILSIGLGGLAVYIIKIISDSPRPGYIYAIESSLSFPSGHTAMATIFTLVTFFVFTRRKNNQIKRLSIVISGLYILLVGCSRLVLGEHWFFDIVGGLLFGLFVVGLTISFHNNKKFDTRQTF